LSQTKQTVKANIKNKFVKIANNQNGGSGPYKLQEEGNQFNLADVKRNNII